MDPNSEHLSPFSWLFGLVASLIGGTIMTYVGLMARVEKVITREVGTLKELLNARLDDTAGEIQRLEERVQRLEDWLIALRSNKSATAPKGGGADD